MIWNVTRMRNRDCMSQQTATGVTAVSDAHRDAAKPHDSSGFKCVLQQDGAIKVARAKASAGGPLRTQPFPARVDLIGNHFITERLTSIQIRHPRPRQYGDSRRRIALAQSLKGGQRHDGVANPIGSPDQDGFKLFQLARTRSLRIVILPKLWRRQSWTVVARACLVPRSQMNSGA